MDEARTVSDDDCRMRPDMASGLSKEPSELIQILKWGGCSTAAVFAFAGLLLQIAQPGNAYETLSRYSWVVATISMAGGFAGAVLDRSEEQQNV